MLAIIPVKKYSSRLPYKNVKKFGKLPLFVHTIRAALKSKYITRVIVSTDCQNIKKISLKNGAEVPFRRPKRLTSKNANTWQVCNDVIKKIRLKEKKIYESIIYLQPTSPLRAVKDINKAIKLFYKKKANAVVSLTESKPKFWYKSISRNGSLISNKSDTKKNFILNGAIYIFKTNFLQSSKSNTYDKKTFAYVMPNKRSIDIDTMIDFKIAEIIYLNK